MQKDWRSKQNMLFSFFVAKKECSTLYHILFATKKNSTCSDRFVSIYWTLLVLFFYFVTIISVKKTTKSFYCSLLLLHCTASISIVCNFLLLYNTCSHPITVSKYVGRANVYISWKKTPTQCIPWWSSLSFWSNIFLMTLQLPLLVKAQSLKMHGRAAYCGL